jgi:hypothetical protein
MSHMRARPRVHVPSSARPPSTFHARSACYMQPTRAASPSGMMRIVGTPYASCAHDTRHKRARRRHTRTHCSHRILHDDRAAESPPFNRLDVNEAGSGGYVRIGAWNGGGDGDTPPLKGRPSIISTR